VFKHFKREEFACNPEKCGCGQNWIDDNFIVILDTLRERAGFPFIVDSGFRCPDYNDKVSSTGRDGPHTTGWAVDIRAITSTQRFRLIRVAIAANCVRLGWGSSFIHIDFCNELDATRYPPEVFWDY
jgi:uncharacterized protein YcbK (DUF882 family)